MVFAPATDENLRLHFVRFMVFAGPASDRIFVRQTARFEVLTGPATDEILGLHFEGSWSLLGLPATEFSCSRLSRLWF